MKTIRELREGRGWTQLELAIKLNVTPVTVYNWERGKFIPSTMKLKQLAQLFDVSMDEITLPEEAKKAAA
jgi:transcriptional regulator with XRE-family HTH domain